LSGRGVEKNPQLALTYLQQAAEQNYTSAIRRLAFCYRDGEGSPRNLPLAVSCFARAAEHDAESAYNYAWCLHHGFGVEPNLPVALAWYVRAAQLQYPPAQEVLPSFRLVRLMPNFGLEWMLKSQNYPKM
jgi:TPR repeat protein